MPESMSPTDRLADQALAELRAPASGEVMQLPLWEAILASLERLLLLAHAAGLDTHDLADDAKRAVRTWVLSSPLPQVRFDGQEPLSQEPRPAVPTEVVEARRRLAEIGRLIADDDEGGSDRLDEERVSLLEQLADYAPGGPNHG